MSTERVVGVACLLLAIAFNLPYAALALQFDYPGILRQPAGEVLAQFHAGGPRLVLTWWAFGLCALAQAGLALAMLDRQRIRPRLATAAAIVGSLAGLTQAMGLWRWAFAVPGLAEEWASAGGWRRAAIETSFDTLHQFGGVAIGEHLGQWLTVAWVLCATAAEHRRGRAGRVIIALALATAGGIGMGALEGLTTVLAIEPGALAYGAPVGYALFTAWLVAIGLRRVMASPQRA